VVRVLRPLVRILLRNGEPFSAFAELAKRVYVEVAMEDFRLPSRKPSISRAAVVTGLTRKEVQRIVRTPNQLHDGDIASYNRAAQVVAGWVRDPDFGDADGSPAQLSLDGEGSFAELVKRYSGDMTSRAVLDELVRAGAAEVVDDNAVRLLSRAYVPAADDRGKLEILGTDVAHLIDTIDHNLVSKAAWFQRKVAYDNLPEEVVERFRAVAREECQALLEELDRRLASQDRDMNPKVAGSGRKIAGVGIYYFEKDYSKS